MTALEVKTGWTLEGLAKTLRALRSAATLPSESANAIATGVWGIVLNTFP
jgi:hypothetical protein